MKLSTVDLPLLFSFAFRSLFILVVLQALIHISLWFAMWRGVVSMPVQINPVYWHGHEMIIGFAGAAIAGFLLTAVATWTGRPHIRGWPLVVLCLGWLIARLGLVDLQLAALAGIFFWVWLFILMAREVVSSSNSRNYKVLVILFVLLLLESLYHYSVLTQQLWQRQIIWSQIGLIVTMINLVGGRIIPAFTRNWLIKQHGVLSTGQTPATFGLIDISATAALMLFFVINIAPVEDSLVITVAIVTALLQAWRLFRWKGYLCFKDPLVWMMHLAYAWIPLGVLLFGLGRTSYIPFSAGIHALAIGAVASMIVSVASRAALGHTGRPLVSHPLLTSAIVFLALSTLSRVSAALFVNGFLLSVSTVLWILGFMCFALRYIPVLMQPSLD